jgi:predicted O-methyltransferase YrrM
MLSLVDIFKKYESFNTYLGTDKGTGHCYDDLYQELLDPIRMSAKTILEIGVFSGASCQVWADYFENATIYGMDINFGVLKFGKNHQRIKYITANGTQSECLKHVPSSFDLVLDDGSHYGEDQIKSAELFVPLINKTGMYICEDIHMVHKDRVHEEFQKIADKNHMNYKMYDLREKKNKYPDDIVVVFKHNI